MRSIALLLILMFGGSAVAAYGQRNAGDGRRGDRSEPRQGGVDVDVDIVFSSDQLRLIRAWFGNRSNLEGLPPGLAKRETLPPGLQRQLRRNGTLPPGLQSKLHAVPHDLERRLPELRPGLSRVIIGGSIVLMNRETSLILDVAAIF